MALEVIVYTVEAKRRQDTPYPASDFYTYDYEEAAKYAQDEKLRLIENTYEWADSNMLADYTPEGWAVVDAEGEPVEWFTSREDAAEYLGIHPGPYEIKYISQDDDEG